MSAAALETRLRASSRPSPWAMGEHVASAILLAVSIFRRYSPSRISPRVNGIKCQKRFLAVRTQWTITGNVVATRTPLPSSFFAADSSRLAAFRGFARDPSLPPPTSAHPSFMRGSFRERRSHLENRAGSHLLRRGMQIAKCVTRFMRRIPKKAAGSPALARGYKSALVAAISFRSHSESRGERDITHGPRNSRQVNKSAATRARARARERERRDGEEG